MLGTIMALNVWMIIILSQRRMVHALKEGKEPKRDRSRPRQRPIKTQHVYRLASGFHHDQQPLSKCLWQQIQLDHFVGYCSDWLAGGKNSAPRLDLTV